MATSVGYYPFEQKLSLAGGLHKLDISLKEEPNELKAVVITAGTFETMLRLKYQGH